MFDPYRVLEISRDASDEEIKKAYRHLSRRYHPDANINNPNKAQAEEKFKQIQEAYNQIMKEREQGYSSGGFGTGNFGNYQQSYNSSDENSIKMQAVANYLNSRHYKEALHILSEMSQKTAQWYYYAAIANAGLGNNVNAVEFAKQAVSMEPNNMEYLNLVTQLSMGSNWYNTMGSDYQTVDFGGGSCCWKLCLINMFCNCCCRPF